MQQATFVPMSEATREERAIISAFRSHPAHRVAAQLRRAGQQAYRMGNSCVVATDDPAAPRVITEAECVAMLAGGAVA